MKTNNLNKATIKIFWFHSKKYLWQTVVSFVCLITISILRTYNPILYKNLINELVTATSKTDIHPMVVTIITIFFFNFARVAVWRGFNFIINFTQPRVMADLTNSCYQYLQKHSFSFFNNNFVGSLVTRVKRYERAYEQITDQIFFNLGRSIIEIVFILLVLIWNFPKLGLMMLVWSVFYFLFAYYYALYKMPYDIKRAEADTKTTAQLADTVTNNINIKLFTSYGQENKRFFQATNHQYELRKKSWNLGTFGDIGQNILNVSLEFLVIYFAVRYWQQGLLSIGDVVLLQAYILRVFDVLWDTGKNVRTIYEAFADSAEMTEILQLPHEVQDLQDAKKLSVAHGNIEFKNVNFSYEGKVQVYSNFNLRVQAGERAAIIGPSGGGKTTIVKLLLRFLDIHSGEILIDGQNIAKVTQDSLRSQIAMVPQEPILFHRSLMDNIRYGRPGCSDEEVIQASRLAHCHEFISQLEEQYNTFVGERGVKLSGGERQRVAIARAILKNAPILILDEATSSLDSESEMYIQDALKTLMKSRTTIVIAHRLSTIMQMDRIIVLENGKITEEGKHEELLKATQGTYQKLWHIQAGGFS